MLKRLVYVTLTFILAILLVSCTKMDISEDGRTLVATHESSLDEIELDYDVNTDMYTVFLVEKNVYINIHGSKLQIRAGYKDEIVVREYSDGTYILFFYKKLD